MMCRHLRCAEFIGDGAPKGKALTTIHVGLTAGLTGVLTDDRRCCTCDHARFHAPGALVFDAFTKPELLKQWFSAAGVVA